MSDSHLSSADTMDYNNSSSTGGAHTDNDDFRGATIVSPILMCFAGVLGNILALLVIRRTKVESQRLMFHSLVAALVWNDLLGILLTTPVTVASYINRQQMPGGEHLCNFNGLVMVCFGLSTPLIVGFMAVERFLFVKYTFFYTKHCAPGAARMIVFALWGFVLFFGCLPLIGFGEFTLQFPQTWCFLNFTTTEPVDAAYGYLYSGMILILVVVMVACNLVVVLTLARVREFRRKHSTGSLNSVLVGDGVLDDTAKQQALAKRRSQKDIEIQMIVVVCAITAVFAVCWVPLMIHILVSLLRGGKSEPWFGLLTIRLASLNQTLNPWLYVILRRTLIVRIKKVCCRWRKLLRKKTRPRPRPAPAAGGRRHQYVHVRNQLCHRNLFVGEELDSVSLTDSMRKSLQRAVPGAISLPDVMMLDTGRRGEQLPLPDIAKAQSFAGRVSHIASQDFGLTDDHCQFDGHTHCPYCCEAIYPTPCGFVSDSDCSECIREREAALAIARVEHLRPQPRRSPPKNISGEENGIAETDICLQEKQPDMENNGEGKQDTYVCDIHKGKGDGKVKYPPSENAVSSVGVSERTSRPGSLCLKHADEASRSFTRGDSTSRGNSSRGPTSPSSKPPSLKRDLVRSKNLSKSSSDGSHSHSHSPRLRRLAGDSSRTSSSVKSSSAGSSVKAKLPLHQSNSLDVPPRRSHPPSPVDFYNKRVKSFTGPAYVCLDNQKNNDSDNNDSENDACESVDQDNTEYVPTTLRTETTTDDYGFSSMSSIPTESVLLSETKTSAKRATPHQKIVKESPKQRSFLRNFGSSVTSKSGKTSDVVSGLPPRATKPGSTKTVKPHSQADQPPSSKQTRSKSDKIPHPKLQSSEESGKQHEQLNSGVDKTTMGSTSTNSPETSSSGVRKDGQQLTSGIFSGESLSATGETETRSKSKGQKEMASDVGPVSNTHDKAIVRKVKSLN